MSDRPTRPPEGVFTRRQFLYIAGGTITVAAAGGVLAACGASATAAPTAAPATAAPSAAAPSAAADCPKVTPSTAKVGGPFNNFTWAGYDGVGVPEIDKFFADNGIEMNKKAITNEDMIAFMKSPSGQEWDASSVNQGGCQYQYAQGVSSPISVEEVPALGQMYDFFKGSELWKVCDGVYNSVPWTWGPITITTRPDKVPADALESYEGLFDAKWKGRIGSYDDALNMVSLGSVATGNDPGKLTRDQLNGPVKAWLKRLQPQLKVLSTSIGDQVNLLVSGDVDIELIGLTWNIPQAKLQGVTVDARVPKEGSYGFVDAVFVTPWAKNRQNAIAYANALISGDTAVGIQNSLFQLGTLDATNARVKKEIRDIFPADLTEYTGKTLKWNVSHFDPNGPYATIEEWTKVWSEVKAGA